MNLSIVLNIMQKMLKNLDCMRYGCTELLNWLIFVKKNTLLFCDVDYT